MVAFDKPVSVIRAKDEGVSGLLRLWLALFFKREGVDA